MIFGSSIINYFRYRNELKRIRKIIMVGDALSVKLSGNIVVEGYIFSTENPRKLKLKIKNIKRPAGYSDIADQYAANVLVDKITSNGYIEVEANSKIISIGQAKFDSVMENLDIL